MLRAEKPQGDRLLPVSEQMKAGSAELADELRGWPQVTLNAFFGFTALYRGKSMFSLLPRTRGIFTGNSVAFRLDGPSQEARSLVGQARRTAAFDQQKTRRFLFEVACDSDLHGALNDLGRAFDSARTPTKTTEIFTACDPNHTGVY